MICTEGRKAKLHCPIMFIAERQNVRAHWSSLASTRHLLFRWLSLTRRNADTHQPDVPAHGAQINYLPSSTESRRRSRASELRHNTVVCAPSRMAPPNRPWFWIGSLISPLCGWSPRRDDLWSCSCGYEWNTFDTGGVCPACLDRWPSTHCLSCAGWSPHSDWYARL
jgi:hypothetical protein